jgi:radical SAM protein with 4Fe4S-binding SPASM domain
MINNKIAKLIRNPKEVIHLLSRRAHVTHSTRYPRSATIEITNVCNLGCHVCDQRQISKRPFGSMKIDQYKPILDEIGPHLEELGLSSTGETFINKDIYKMFAYTRISAPKAYISLDTNGHFTDAERILENPPDEISYSVDGLEQDTYVQYRVNGKLEKVLKNIKALTCAKKKIGSSLPKVLFKFIVMKHNEHEIERVPEFAENLGCDGYRLQSFTSREFEDGRYSESATAKLAKKFMSTLPEFQKYDAKKIEEGIFASHMKQLTTPCGVLWDDTDILFNGDIRPCVCDYDGEFKFGNFFEDGGFWNVWNGEKARAFRKAHKSPSYRKNISMCSNCYLTNYHLDPKIHH